MELLTVGRGVGRVGRGVGGVGRVGRGVGRVGGGVGSDVGVVNRPVGQHALGALQLLLGGEGAAGQGQDSLRRKRRGLRGGLAQKKL